MQKKSVALFVAMIALSASAVAAAPARFVKFGKISAPTAIAPISKATVSTTTISTSTLSGAVLDVPTTATVSPTDIQGTPIIGVIGGVTQPAPTPFIIPTVKTPPGEAQPVPVAPIGLD